MMGKDDTDSDKSRRKSMTVRKPASQANQETTQMWRRRYSPLSLILLYDSYEGRKIYRKR